MSGAVAYPGKTTYPIFPWILPLCFGNREKIKHTLPYLTLEEGTRNLESYVSQILGCHGTPESLQIDTHDSRDTYHGSTYTRRSRYVGELTAKKEYEILLVPTRVHH